MSGNIFFGEQVFWTEKQIFKFFPTLGNKKLWLFCLNVLSTSLEEPSETKLTFLKYFKGFFRKRIEKSSDWRCPTWCIPVQRNILRDIFCGWKNNSFSVFRNFSKYIGWCSRKTHLRVGIFFLAIVLNNFQLAEFLNSRKHFLDLYWSLILHVHGNFVTRNLFLKFFWVSSEEFFNCCSLNWLQSVQNKNWACFLLKKNKCSFSWFLFGEVDLATVLKDVLLSARGRVCKYFWKNFFLKISQFFGIWIKLLAIW